MDMTHTSPWLSSACSWYIGTIPDRLDVTTGKVVYMDSWDGGLGKEGGSSRGRVRLKGKVWL